MDAREEDAATLDATQAVAAMRAEVVQLRAGLARLDDGLTALERRHRPAGSTRGRPERYLKVLVDVYERGGRHGVDAAAFAGLGARHGYDPRGLGGFFTGTRASLRRSEGRVTLTALGEHLVDAYLNELSG